MGLVFDADLVVWVVLVQDLDHVSFGLADIGRIHPGTAKARIHMLIQFGVHTHRTQCRSERSEEPLRLS